MTLPKLTTEEEIQLAEELGKIVIQGVRDWLSKRSQPVTPSEATAKIGELDSALASNDAKADASIDAKFPANKEPGK